MPYIPPSAGDLIDYLGDDTATDFGKVVAAFDAELQAQLRACRPPDQLDASVVAAWPADLTEALSRRVAHNLAMRGLPLGVQASVTTPGTATNAVGGLDAEVRRLEAPYRRRPIG